MAQSQFSLLWDTHKKNICSGLSALQQNGEFVDMTLAADGHLVKVHQVIIALASPYIRELLSSAQCPHPIIFLNKISYQTLSSILEYVYTGEVVVTLDNLNEFLQAGKELHIKGLEDMKIHDTSYSTSQPVVENNEVNEADCDMEVLNDEDISYFEITNCKDNDDSKYIVSNIGEGEEEPEAVTILEHDESTVYTDGQDEETTTDTVAFEAQESSEKQISIMQYTVSNQGSLQMILNRYMYYLKHSNRDNTRQWRCVDYLNNVKCPAHVFTKDDVVVQRIAAHVHPYHDKKILKKVRDGAVYSAISKAEIARRNRKNQIAE